MEGKSLACQYLMLYLTDENQEVHHTTVDTWRHDLIINRCFEDVEHAGKVTKQRNPKSPLQLVDEFVDEGVTEQEPIREPDSGRIQPLPDVQGKGKEKVNDEQVALDLLTLQTPKKKRLAEHIFFQEVSPITTEPSSTLNPLHYEGQAGPNLGIQDEGQARSNPGDAAESQPQSSHAVHAGLNLEHMDFEVTNASTQQNPKQMDEEFTKTAYPNVQENLKLPTKDQVILEEPASSAGTLSSLQNLDKELSFTNQFLVEKS
ncbi:hypothetical protein Tco_0173156 [Tanacetum coccineum]